MTVDYHQVEEVEYLDFKVKKSVLEETFRLLAAVSKLDSLENAISVAKMFVFDESELKRIELVSILYKAECSGFLKPPISLELYYKEIYNKMKERA